MVTIRRSLPSSLVLLGALASGCTGAVPPAVGQDGKRHPDGIAVDPLETPPEARETAASSSGVVALRSPLGVEAAHATVRAFFEAVSREDGDGLMRVLSMDAVWLNPSSRAREPAFSVFSRRFGRLDYTGLSGLTYWNEDAVLEGDAAVASWADVVGTASTTGMPTPTGATAFPDALTPADVVVRAPITIGRGSSSGLFGGEVILALRRDGDRFVIHRIAEDFILNP
jgi:ketosteroid isomerase-like protein